MPETTKPLTEDQLIDLYASIVPASYLRSTMSALGGDLSSVTGLPRFETERRIVAAMATARGLEVCVRCGGTGQYGHHGTCFDCGGRRVL
jgi:hypothetical protein